MAVEKLSIPFSAVYLSSLLALPCVAQACSDVFMMSQRYEKQNRKKAAYSKDTVQAAVKCAVVSV